MPANTSKAWFLLKPHVAIWLTGWLAGALLLALQGYNQSFLTLNALHFPALDRLMPHFTHLGDGILPVSVFALLILHRDRGLVLSALMALIVASLLNAVLKDYFYWPRPPLVFGQEAIHYITVQQEQWLSFPSGHSLAAAVTGVFCALAFPQWRRWWSVLTAMMAMAVCYTRIYIGVHFLGDVLAGSAIGLLFAVAAMLKLPEWMNARFQRWSKRKNTIFNIVLYLTFLIIIFFDLKRLLSYY